MQEYYLKTIEIGFVAIEKNLKNNLFASKP